MLANAVAARCTSDSVLPDVTQEVHEAPTVR